MAVRWLFYTPASITSSYWPGLSCISSSLSTLSFPGRAAETVGTQVGPSMNQHMETNYSRLLGIFSAIMTHCIAQSLGKSSCYWVTVFLC